VTSLWKDTSLLLQWREKWLFLAKKWQISEKGLASLVTDMKWRPLWSKMAVFRQSGCFLYLLADLFCNFTSATWEKSDGF
jgi:hypothetical protein